MTGTGSGSVKGQGLDEYRASIRHNDARLSGGSENVWVAQRDTDGLGGLRLERPFSDLAERVSITVARVGTFPVG